jgi:arylformamidase
LILYDITPPVTPQLAVWPGDVPFSRHVALSIAGGANLDLSSITTTLHVGAHADAPSHYVGDGVGIGERPLERYLGACQVVRVDVPRGTRVEPRHVVDPIVAPRVLFHTGTFPDPHHWNSDFASLSPALIDWLASLGVILVGIDTPSVDLQDDRELLSHRAIARHDLAILEGIVLDRVPVGRYTLVALPLRLPGADASPVRAVLLPAEALQTNPGR